MSSRLQDDPLNAAVEQGTAKNKRGGRLLLMFLLPPIMLGVLAVFTVRSRAADESRVVATTKTLAVQHVSIVHPKRGDSVTEIDLPGTTEAFTESPIFARTNGYLRSWTKDIGSHVKAGELLAQIETPELDQQLSQSRAILAQTDANLKLARITASRYQDLIPSHSVSQQEVDQNNQNLAMLTASRNAASADVQRLEQLQAFEKVCAPFDGIITARNTDIGDLINSGSATGGAELFRVARIDTLRIFVNVPEDYSSSIRPGMHASVHIAGYPGQAFAATVARSANAVDPNSRTMRTELDIPNRAGKLLPGAYASASFQLRAPMAPLVLPSNTLIFQAAGMQVGIVDQNNKVRLRNITIARDLGTSVEVISGLQPNDAVIANPPDSLTEGTPVAVQTSQTNTTGS
jgi:RND family efflux transporter MFP subunit